MGLPYGSGSAPDEYADSPVSDLAHSYRDDYTVMLAAGFMVDGDADGALDRLRRLGVDNVPAYVQEITERYITNSRDLEDIRLLVNLSAGLGRLTPPMERFRHVNPGGAP
jgi:hypothetical protein